MPEEATALVIGIWHPAEGAVKYAIMRAHPFGLASTVLNFCRLPTLATAAIRQWTGTASAGYFGDSGILDVICRGWSFIIAHGLRCTGWMLQNDSPWHRGARS